MYQKLFQIIHNYLLNYFHNSDKFCIKFNQTQHNFLPALNGPVAKVLPSKQQPNSEDSHFGFFFQTLHCLVVFSFVIISINGLDQDEEYATGTKELNKNIIKLYKTMVRSRASKVPQEKREMFSRSLVWGISGFKIFGLLI